MNICDGCKSDSGGWHGRAKVSTGRAKVSTGRAKLLTWRRHIFVSQSSYFCIQSAPSPFLLLQDSIHPIFIPEIK
ncbi:hypothetical protein MTR_7g046450 [Medicago truncatula]|uniref:Uncharacterized protein n=1 Tax=Medicago truncatula TaxID=3880 RepID=G7KUY0_MEDTR|nr:hypothetical protein MTR_7g046450 [Medicago truncatula]